MEQGGIAGGDIEDGEAELAFIAGADGSAEDMRDQLLAVTDAQDGNARGQDRGVDGGAGFVVNAAGAARDDDSLRQSETLQWSFAWKYFRGYAQVADLAGDVVTVLAPCIEDGDLGGRVYFCILVCFYFCIRSAAILRAEESSVWALGSAFTAASTSGSVRVSYFCFSSTLKAV